MSNDNQKLVEEAVFGQQVEDFFRSDIGKYLLSRCDDELTAAVAEFRAADPSDHKKMAKIQARMWRADSFHDWLGEAIQAGRNALGILEDRGD